MLKQYWLTFKRNKRALISLYLFLIFFGLSIFAEIISNDKPILIRSNNQFYFPLLKTYYETDFGGELSIAVDYNDSYTKNLINQNGWIIWPLIRYSFDTINFDIKQASPSPPSAKNWLGTDDQARDVLARSIYGYRISVLFGLILTAFSAIIGVLAGAVQGYFGGRIDLYFQRFIEIWAGLPMLFILIIIASVVQPGFWILLAIMLLFNWTGLVGVVRAECLRTRKFEFVAAAQALGVPEFQLIIRHILPNAMVATFTFLPFMLSGSIATLTALDFLGFGMPPGTASLGEMLAQGKNNLHAIWLGLTSFFVLSFLLIKLIFIGEGIRDAFDPRNVLT